MKKLALALGLAGSMAMTLCVTSSPTSATATVQPGWCGWTPANNSNILARVYVGPVNIRTGQGTDCNVISQAQEGDWVWLHCQVINGGGERWFYLWDSANGKTGWVKAGAVERPFDPRTC
ncbi:SH3 domain-containing protein [Sphaerimonospora cavernae]|uniref:SH3 domain-containing protein n=1 Tax=Sphaerimonospora cavernae TaxID=1740611 RepID=A0ABV6U1Z3_9ACTN